MHQTLLKLRISQEEAAKQFFSTIHQKRRAFTEEAFHQGAQ
jgi:hypothetical protein